MARKTGQTPNNTLILPNDLSGTMMHIGQCEDKRGGHARHPVRHRQFAFARSVRHRFAGQSTRPFTIGQLRIRVANQNLANVPIPSGYVDMTGFFPLYGNSNVPKFPRFR